MQGGRGRGRGNLFNPDPFVGFGGFGGQNGLMPSLFGGRDPFDDPFFTQPPGSMFESHRNLMPSLFGGRDPFNNPFFTQPPGSMFEPSIFGPREIPFLGPPFAGAPHAGFIEQQDPNPNKRRGPVIEELSSDGEEVETGGPSRINDFPRKHSRLDKEPYVEIPDDESNGGRNKRIQRRAELGNNMNNAQPQSQFYTFQSSSVSYGGGDGACYTKSMTRRAGSDGVAFEEFKEADSTTGQANHRISRGLHNKGHTLSRKLKSDGKVDTEQMLHNLNEGELDGFEQAWDGSSGRHLTGSRHRLEDGNNFGPGSGQAQRGVWALPSTENPMNPGRNNSHIANGTSEAHTQQHKGRSAADRGKGKA